MWWLLVTAEAGVGEIRTLAVQEDGQFQAVCEDGHEEKVTAADIRADRVCGSPAGGVVCTGAGGIWAYVTRISDGKRIGSMVEAQVCHDIVQAARTTVCAPTGGPWAYVANVADSRNYGQQVDLSTCMQVTRRSGVLTCAPTGGPWSYLARVDSGSTLGAQVELKACVASLPSVTLGP